jgi:hypothetical protein
VNRRYRIVGILAAACYIAASLPMTSLRGDEMDRVRTAMAALVEKTGKLGTPTARGVYPAGGTIAPGLFFGYTRMNNAFGVVDEVAREQGGAVALFVKSGDRFVRVATNIRQRDGSRAVGTILDPNSPVIAIIRKGEAYYGEATILGRPAVTGYAPILDPFHSVIGIYFVGQLK